MELRSLLAQAYRKKQACKNSKTKQVKAETGADICVLMCTEKASLSKLKHLCSEIQPRTGAPGLLKRDRGLCP